MKPTLSTKPASRAASSPAKVAAPSACTMFSTPSGSPPPRTNSSWKAAALAAAYSAGFQTTVLPASSAGTMYQDGTATGKLPAVMIAIVPTGLRNVNSCLSGISLGTVCPYRRRPSPRKKSQVSTISRTSPSASAYGLPISAVTIRARASALASISRPIWAMARPRTGAGTAAQPAWALWADSAAPRKTDASARLTSATTSPGRAGLLLVIMVEPVTGWPSTTDVTVRVVLTCCSPPGCC